MPEATRRDFLKHAGQGTLAAGLAMALPEVGWSKPVADSTAAAQGGPAVSSPGGPARFSQDFLANPVYAEQPLSFNPLPPAMFAIPLDPKERERTGLAPQGRPMEVGVFAQPNGDMLFRIYAPSVQKVQIHLLAMEPRPWLTLTRQPDGMHVGVFPYDPAFCGPMSTDVVFDGTVLIYPYLPVFWHRDRPVNFFEIPDPETEYIQIRNVPHGSVARELIWIKRFGYQRSYVYTPPEYHKGGTYPVLYLQAGGGENETTWEFNGRFAHILDNLLAEGKCKPFVLVTCDGGVKYAEKLPGRGSAIPGFRDMLIGDVMPFVEAKYRVKADKWNRAMAGLSRGSHQTSSIGFSHPELFAYLGMFSGYMSEPHEVGGSLQETEILRDPKRFAKEYKVVFRCMGADDHLMPHFVADNAAFAANGLDQLPNYHYKLYANQKHLWGAFRRGLYDFAQLIF